MTHHDSMTRHDAREAPSPAVRRATGLRARAFGAVIMLLAEYCLGAWVNLYIQLPASDHPRHAFTRILGTGAVTAGFPPGPRRSASLPWGTNRS